MGIIVSYHHITSEPVNIYRGKNVGSKFSKIEY